MFEAAVSVGLILGIGGFIFGHRPSRTERPPRILGMLGCSALFVFMAAWALLDHRLFSWFQGLFSDSKGMAVAVALELIVFAGTLVLVPVAGYTVGRTIACKRRRSAQSNTSRN